MKTISKLALLTLLVSALPAAAKELDTLAARVNNEPITLSDYEKAKASLTEQYSTAMPDFFKQPDAASQLEKAALDKLIDEALLRQKADSLKIKVYERELETGVTEIRKRFSTSPDGTALPQDKAEAAFRDELKKEGVTMEEFRERIRKQLMVQKLVQDTIKSRVKIPGEADVKAYFENIKLVLTGKDSEIKGLSADDMQDLKAIANRFREATAERLRLRHILIRTKEGATPEELAAAKAKALEAGKALDGGMDFDEAVAKYSEDEESARQLGDLGYIVKGMLPEELEPTAFAMQVGSVSQPQQTKFGWHILRLEEKRAEQKLRFDPVKDDLERVLSQNSFATELASYLKDLRKEAKVQTFIGDKKTK